MDVENVGHHMDLQNVDCSENDELGHYLNLQKLLVSVNSEELRSPYGSQEC